MKTKRRHIRRARTFMGRVVGLLAITLALYALFATTTYGLLSRTTFNNIKANELLPKLEKITDLIEHSLPDEECDSETGIAASDMKSLSLLKQLDPDLLDAYLLIVNSAGDSLYNNVMPDDVTPGMTLGTNLEKVIAGESVIFTLSMPAWRIDALAVGAPIVQCERVVGGVFLFKPQVEIYASQYSVFMALLFSMGIVLLVALPLTYLIAQRISRPVRQMRDVALRMAHAQLCGARRRIAER